MAIPKPPTAASRTTSPLLDDTAELTATVLIKAAEAMGHSNPQSLRPYLTYVLNRRNQAADATKVTKLESRLRQLKLQEGTIVQRIDQHHKLQIIARQMRAGNDVDAAAAFREIADQLLARCSVLDRYKQGALVVDIHTPIPVM